MATTVLAPYLKTRWVDGAGNPLYLGTINTYAAGTLTPIATYKDSTGGSTNTNPIVLNARGECDLWLTPNVAYKFIVADANGNLIPGGTIDNVINSQLITLYGGVDTGVANAYVLNFAASFTALIDGIVIIWIPATNNTTSSTINVNGLGVVNIVNPDGTPLQQGEILANQPAQILFKGGVFQLITPSTNLTGTFAPVYAGFSIQPSTSVFYRRTGNIVALTFAGTGTSNATGFQLSNLPATLTPTGPISQIVPCWGLSDNGADLATPGIAQILSTGVINFFKVIALTNTWTNVGSKGFNTLGNRVTVIYSL